MRWPASIRLTETSRHRKSFEPTGATTTCDVARIHPGLRRDAFTLFGIHHDPEA